MLCTIERVRGVRGSTKDYHLWQTINHDSQAESLSAYFIDSRLPENILGNMTARSGKSEGPSSFKISYLSEANVSSPDPLGFHRQNVLIYSSSTPHPPTLVIIHPPALALLQKTSSFIQDGKGNTTNGKGKPRKGDASKPMATGAHQCIMTSLQLLCSSKGIPLLICSVYSTGNLSCQRTSAK